MRSDEPDSDSVGRSVRAVQETVQKAVPAAAAGYTLVGAVLGIGAIGYGIDYWLDTFPWCLAAGLMLGMAVGFYELIKSTRR